MRQPQSQTRPGWPRVANSFRLRGSAVMVGACSIVLTGCSTPEARQDLPLQNEGAFSVSGGVPLRDRWWEEFGDPDLDRVIEGALRNNFDLRVAYERIREARATVGIEDASRFPALDATAGAELRDGSDTDGQSEISLGLEASYEVDLWGRIRSEIDAATFEASATVEDYQAAAVTLSAELATAVYRRTEAVQQLALLDSQLKTNRNVLTVLEERFAIGQSGSADVLRQRQLVEGTLEQQIIARSSLEVLEHQILALLGMSPQSPHVLPPVGSLPEMPALPEIGLPSELLQRRPDVRAALHRIESADASVAAAVRDQYPSLNIGASLSTAASNPAGLFDSWIASLVGQVVAPLVDGGRREQEVERTVAIRRQRLAAYGDTVVSSFQEVEDALSLERHQTNRIDNLVRQLDLSRSTSAQLRAEYLNGAADFIDVLVAIRDQQELERSVLSARLARVETRITLYRAIAGGFMDEAEDGLMNEKDERDVTTGDGQG